MHYTKCSCKNCFVFILVSVILGIGLTVLSVFLPIMDIVDTLIMTIFSGTALLMLGILTAITCSSDCIAMKRALMQNSYCTVIAAVIGLVFGILNSIAPFGVISFVILFITITAFLVLLMSFSSIIITTVKYFIYVKDN